MNTTARPRLKYLEITRSRHGRVVVYFRRKGSRVRLPDDTRSAEFAAAYALAMKEQLRQDVRDMRPTPMELRLRRSERSLRSAFRACRTRARGKGLPFNLTLDAIMRMARAQEYRCALTGIEFFADHQTTSRVHPFTPSVDRVVPALGYVHGNVRLLVYVTNAMLLDWGEPLFVQIANSYRYWKRTKAGNSISAPEGTSPALPENASEINC